MRITDQIDARGIHYRFSEEAVDLHRRDNAGRGLVCRDIYVLIGLMIDRGG
jgi:hypothetical protein